MCRSGNTAAARRYRARLKAQGKPSPTQKARPAKRTPCSDCGAILRGGGTSAIPRCQPCLLSAKYKTRRLARRLASATRKLTKAASGVPANAQWPWVAGECAHCRQAFTRKGGPSPYCSKICHRADRPKASWITRRARLAIYERDGWICQLCLDPVDPSLHYLDNKAATLDHIKCRAWTEEPDHSPENLRLAHRWCNSWRGDESYCTETDMRPDATAA